MQNGAMYLVETHHNTKGNGKESSVTCESREWSDHPDVEQRGRRFGLYEEAGKGQGFKILFESWFHFVYFEHTEVGQILLLPFTTNGT